MREANPSVAGDRENGKYRLVVGRSYVIGGNVSLARISRLSRLDARRVYFSNARSANVWRHVRLSSEEESLESRDWIFVSSTVTNDKYVSLCQCSCEKNIKRKPTAYSL